MEFSWKKMLSDMIPVIFGILVALFLNDWKDQRDNQRFLDRVMNSIELEIRENKSDIEEVIPLQNKFIDSLEVHLDNPDVSIADLFVVTGGIKIPTVKNTAWRSFLNTNIELVDYEVISILTEIEEARQFFKLKLSTLMEFGMMNSASIKREDKQMLMVQLLNVMDSEEGLLEDYENYLAE